MSASARDRLVDTYLDALRDAASALSESERDELMASISEHISLALPPAASDVEVRRVLDRLGDPQQIVRAGYDLSPSPRFPRARDWGAVALLLLGGVILPVLGWFGGLILLWSSPTWTVRDKWIGTFVVPGGLATPLFLGVLLSSHPQCFNVERLPGGPVVTHCTGGQSTPTQVLVILLGASLVTASIATAIYLARRIRPHSVAV